MFIQMRLRYIEMFLKYGKAATVTFTIALSMVLIFGFRAFAQKKHDANEGLSQAPVYKSIAATSGPHKASSAPVSFSLHPAARYAAGAGAHTDEADDSIETGVHGVTFPRVAQEEFIQPDLNSYIRTSDNGSATADNMGSSLFSSSPTSPPAATAPLLFSYNPSSTSTNNPTTTTSNNPTGNPSYAAGIPSYSPGDAGNPPYVPAGNSSATPVPSSFLLLGSGLIAFRVLRSKKTFCVQRSK